MKFGFAWVDEENNTFLEEYFREDEKVFLADLVQEENQAAALTLEIKNPGGLLSPERKRWLWYSWKNALDVIEPLFFGSVVAIPSDINGNKITINLTASPSDLDGRKLAVAQTKKKRPEYDPIWVDRSRQNDPDVVLECYPEIWTIDRVTHEVLTSSVVDGEDGTITFNPGDMIYNSVKLSIEKIPLPSVSVQANVGYTQKKTGTIVMEPKNIQTYTGDGLISDWPKPFSNMAPGWSAGNSEAVDARGTKDVTSKTYGYSYKNKSKTHDNGDLLSIDLSYTIPPINPDSGFSSNRKVSGSVTYGFGPTGGTGPAFSTSELEATQDNGGAPSISVNISEDQTLSWVVSLFLELKYEMARDRKENLGFTLSLNSQAVTQGKSKKIPSDSLIRISGLDVGSPMDNVAILTATGNVSNGDTVTIGQSFYTFQSSLTAGIGHVLVGATAAASLTNLLNAINVNGLGSPDVDYAIENLPNESAYAVYVNSTSIKLIAISSSSTDIDVATSSSSLSWKAPGSFTLTGSGNVIQGNTVTISGITYTFDEEVEFQIEKNITLTQRVLKQIPYHVLIGVDLESSLLNLASAINASGGAGSDYAAGTLQNVTAIAVVVGSSLIVSPRYAGSAISVSESSAVLSWSDSVSVLVPDQNTVPMVDVSRPTYFDTDRGARSLESLIARARAKLLFSSRAAKLEFSCRFGDATILNCRKNILAIDPSLPGGQVIGKVTKYRLFSDGNQGTMLGSVTAGCCVGFENVVEEAEGDETYVEGYVVGYRESENRVITLFGGEVGYSPLVGNAVDSVPFATSRIINDYVSQEEILRRTISNSGNSLLKHHVLYELILSAITNGPTTTNFVATLTDLEAPMHLDLYGES